MDSLIISLVILIFERINQSFQMIEQQKLEASIFYQPILSVSKSFYPTVEQWYQRYLDRQDNQIIQSPESPLESQEE